MTGVGRLFAILFGYIVAVLAAGVFLATLFVSIIPFDRSPPLDLYAGGVFFGLFFSAPLVGSVAFVPAACVILVTEVFRLRDWLYHAAGGGLVGVLAAAWLSAAPERGPVPPDAGFLMALAGAGMVGGIAYWLIAGRNAGRWIEEGRPRQEPSGIEDDR